MATLKCPACGHMESEVRDSRSHADGGAIRRRRHCTSCHERYTTFEMSGAQLAVLRRTAAMAPRLAEMARDLEAIAKGIPDEE